MEKNKLLKCEKNIIRVLDSKDDMVLIIDCIKQSMPTWICQSELIDYIECSEQELLTITNMKLTDAESMNAVSKRIVHERYTLIAGVLPFISDKKNRSYTINQIAAYNNISKQTVRYYLCLYLTYQNIFVLAPKTYTKTDALTADEKNMRWALNKFFYNKNKNTLTTAYTMMLKEKYCNNSGILSEKYPSFYQFRYFYRKHKKLQTYYISRDGLKNYQRNNRPLLGDSVQEFAPSIGIGMLDATICDIYLVNSAGQLVGRPILTACIDAYSGLCCGYALTWEGGMYSLRMLMLNIISDKVQLCKRFGISINQNEWNCDKLPATFVTDMGSEYKSGNFEQITELGVTVINLPAYRPELKGSVEKFFDVIQNLFKPFLKGKGVIEEDYQERGAHDYRKDACLTIEAFEKIILHCIIYYNNKRIVENFPYTEEMLSAQVKPYANCIWEWGKSQTGANLIDVDSKKLVLTLLPRTIGKFSRFGLKVNKLRYHHDGYTEAYLSGNNVAVAYNPDDVTSVWIIEDGKYVKFKLIETRFENKALEDVQTIQRQQKYLIQNAVPDNIQARIDLAEHIETISSNGCIANNIYIKSARDARRKEQDKKHINFMREDELNEQYN